MTTLLSRETDMMKKRAGDDDDDRGKVSLTLRLRPEWKARLDAAYEELGDRARDVGRHLSQSKAMESLVMWWVAQPAAEREQFLRECVRARAKLEMDWEDEQAKKRAAKSDPPARPANPGRMPSAAFTPLADRTRDGDDDAPKVKPVTVGTGRRK